MSHSAEQHFSWMICLMLLFFCVNYISEALLALGMTSVKIGGNAAHDAFMAFFGVALGIFRGLQANGHKPKDE